MPLTTFAELQTAIENEIGDTTINARVLEFITQCQLWIRRNVRTRSMEAMVDLRLEAAQAGGNATGTADAQLVAITGFTGPTLGDTVTFNSVGTNTGAVTLNVQSTGVIALRKGDGSSTSGVLEANDLISGHAYRAYYDGAVWRLTPDGGIPLPTRFLGVRRLFLQTDPKGRISYIPAPDFWQKYLGTTTGQPTAYTIESDFIVFGPLPDTTYSARLMFWQGPPTISASVVPRLFADNPDLYLYGSLIHAAPYLGDDARTLTWAGMFKQIVDDMAKEDRRARTSGAPLVVRSDSPNP